MNFIKVSSARIKVNPPNIIINNTVLTEDADASDSDGVINPGEHFWIEINLENEQGWQDATDINAVLSTDYEGVTINTNSAYCASLGSGETCTAEYDFTLSGDISLGDIEFNLLTTATGPDDYDFSADLNFELNVSVHQAGFPVDVAGAARLLYLDWQRCGKRAWWLYGSQPKLRL